MSEITRKEQPTEKLTPVQRRFVLRSIGEHRTTRWIIDQLKQNWDIERSELSIDRQYRYGHQYKEQVTKYREAFNAKEREHPLFNRQIQLNYLQTGLEIAIENRDSKAIAALINQIKDITGTASPTDVEITHHNGTQSLNDILKGLNLGANNQTIDAQVEPMPDPTLPILPPAPEPEPSIDTSFQE